MKTTAALFATLAVCSAASAQRVLVIGVDGLKPDCIPLAETPALDRLIAEGSYNDDAQAEDLTFSGPNWASILHGVHRDKHGVVNNEYRPQNLRQYPDFLTYIERADPTMVTAKVVAWDPIGKFQPTEADFNEIPEGDDAAVTDVVVEMLSGQYPGMPGGPDTLFVHLDEVDGAGHTYGFDTSQPMYLAGITKGDALIGRITKAMRDRPNYDDENWLVIVVSDHGGSIDKGHSGNTPEKRTMPFIVSGKAAVQGGRHFPQPRTCDVPATALTHMGIEIDPAWDIDSRPIGLAKTARPEARLGENLIYNGDAEANRGFGSRGIDGYLLGWDDPGPSQWTVLTYDAVPGLADIPPSRGNNLFAGGMGSELEMIQRIDLGPISDAIADGATATLSAWLGGVGDERDPAMCWAQFLHADGGALLVIELPPVGVEQRNGETKLIYRTKSARIPAEAAYVDVRLVSFRRTGAECDALADNLSLVVTKD